MYFKGLTFIFSEDPPENHLKVIGGLLLKYYVLLLLLFRYVVYFPKLSVERTVLFDSTREQLYFPDTWKALDNCTVPFGRKFSPFFPYTDGKRSLLPHRARFTSVIFHS